MPNTLDEHNVSVRDALERAKKLTPDVTFNEKRFVEAEIEARKQHEAERVADEQNHHEMSKQHAIEREAKIAAGDYGTKEANPIVAAERAKRDEEMSRASLPSAQELTKKMEALKAQYRQECKYLEKLLYIMHNTHFADHNEWRPISGDLMGMLTQLDNMMSAWTIKPPLVPHEIVNHPDHYGGKDDPYEVIKIMAHKLDFEEFVGAMKFMICKHTLRAGRKYGHAAYIDFAKAKFYADYLVSYTRPKGMTNGTPQESN